MSRIIAISGAASTGKSSIVDSLYSSHEMLGWKFIPDAFDEVWNDLVDKKIFQSFSEVCKDNDYLCIFVLKLLDYYNEHVELYSKSDDSVVMDASWIDIAIYAIINMWYNPTIKSVQDSILSRVSIFNKNIDRIYITSYDENKQVIVKNREPFKMSHSKLNRPLELDYYKLATNLKNTIQLPSSEVEDCRKFILNDLKNLGYLEES